MTRGPGRHSEQNFRAAEQHYNAAECYYYYYYYYYYINRTQGTVVKTRKKYNQIKK